MKSKQGKYWELFAFGLFAALVFKIFYGNNFLPNGFGSGDFIEYWAGFKLATLGQNPYSYGNMLNIQRSLNPETVQPMLMWNPPHLLILLGPILILDFSNSAAIFAAFNILCLAALFHYTVKILQPTIEQVPRLWIIGFSFPATLICLQVGQLGIILALALVSGLYCYFHRKKFVAGCLFALCTVKPHLFLLVFAIILLNDLKEREWRTIFGGLLTLSLLCVTTQIAFPGIFEQWFHSLAHPEQVKGLTLTNWRPATLIGLSRVLYWRLTDLPMPFTPMWLLPLINLVIWVVISLKVGTDVVLKTFLPELLLFSVLFSPYGWLFDQVFLIVSWSWALLQLEELIPNKPLLTLLILMGTTSLTYVGIQNLDLVSESFVTVTLTMLLVVTIIRCKLKES